MLMRGRIEMATVRIGVASRTEVLARAKAAFRGEKQGNRISFASLELMHRVLTPNRWRILQVMMGAGPLGVRALARELDRDVKSVHLDVQALLNTGVIDRTDDRKVEFRYDAVHVDFTVKAA
jgi:predicted transcriptional regulator